MKKNDACERYLLDPEGAPAHLESCGECRALYGAGQRPVEPPPISIDDLPLAPWEGASHRAWLLVVGAALAVLALASAMFVVTGVSPLNGLANVLGSMMPASGVVRDLPRVISDAARNAPAGWQIVIGISFVVVNTLLVLLLRRAPRGIDV